jgi:hypothetical protein
MTNEFFIAYADVQLALFLFVICCVYGVGDVFCFP